jgi:hypothetical protein
MAERTGREKTQNHHKNAIQECRRLGVDGHAERQTEGEICRQTNGRTDSWMGWAGRQAGRGGDVQTDGQDSWID